jgi:antitoxin component of RelBE/YafQ-DinJ toxin-antitoxin module
MKNITVSVDDEVYHRARMWAAARRTSVSAMVRQMLIKVAADATPFERRRLKERELRERLRSRGFRFAASDRLSREALHDRNALR